MISQNVKLPVRAYLGPALLIIVALSILVLSVISIHSFYQNKYSDVSELRLKREKLEGRIQQQELEIARGLETADKTDVWIVQTPTEALSAVQKKVGELSKISKIELRSFRKTTYAGSQLEQGFDVAVRVEGNASLETFYSFVQLIENNSPQLFIVDTSIRRLTRQTTKSLYPQVFFILTIVAPLRVVQEAVE